MGPHGASRDFVPNKTDEWPVVSMTWTSLDGSLQLTFAAVRYCRRLNAYMTQAWNADKRTGATGMSSVHRLHAAGFGALLGATSIALKTWTT